MQTFDKSYEINEDLTQAILEKIRDRLDFARKVEEHDGDAVAAVLDDLPIWTATGFTERCSMKRH